MTAHSSGSSVFQDHAATIARAVLGDPNESMSSATELRFGAKGSVSVRIGGERKGTWHDHHANTGGGMLDLVRDRKCLDKPGALDFVRGLGVPLDPPSRGKQPAQLGPIVATYDYLDENGVLLFQVTRHDPKTFRQRHPDGQGGWRWGLGGIKPVLYRLPELCSAFPGDPVFLAEGEKDVDALIALGLVATGSPMGAANWRDDYAAFFKARDVVILPDNDPEGENYAETAAASLAKVTQSVRVLRLPGLPPKGDLSDWLAAGGTSDELAALAALVPFYGAETADEAPEPQKPGRRLLTPAECVDSPSRGYVLKGALAPGDVAIIFGEPGAGKSILTPHVAYAVAQGRVVFDRRVKSGPVIYVAAEDPHGMMQRIKAHHLTHGDAPGFHLLVKGADLRDPDGQDRAALLADCRRLQPALVVVDTLKAAFSGLDENTSEDMGIVIDFARDIAATGAAVILVHHSPKGGDTPRGHSSLNGDADMTIRVAIEEANRVTGTFLKNRNGPSGTRLSFTIHPVELGLDDDGEQVTAPVAREDDPAEKRPARIHLSPTEMRAKGFLSDVTFRHGKPLPEDGWHPKMLGITEEQWQDECEQRRLSSAETDVLRKKVFRRAYKDLLEKKVVGARGGLVWLADSAIELREIISERYRARWNNEAGSEDQTPSSVADTQNSPEQP